MQMQTEKYPEWLNEEERKVFDTFRDIVKQFDAECLMMYPNSKTVYMITPEEVETAKVLPIVDRYAGGEPLAFSHIGIPNLTFEEKEEGRFYYVEENTTL